MSTITDESNLFNFVVPTTWLGQFAASTGTQDFGEATRLQTNYVAFISYAPLTHGLNTYFKMQGFNLTTGKYEVWFSKGDPLLKSPSGSTLSNIEIVLTWIDR